MTRYAKRPTWQPRRRQPFRTVCGSTLPGRASLTARTPWNFCLPESPRTPSNTSALCFPPSLEESSWSIMVGGGFVVRVVVLWSGWWFCGQGGGFVVRV